MSTGKIDLSVLYCDQPGCGADGPDAGPRFYQGSQFSYAADARREAARLGWRVDVPGPLPFGMTLASRRARRADFCPEHAEVSRTQDERRQAMYVTGQWWYAFDRPRAN